MNRRSINKISKLQHLFYVLKELEKISKQLHHLDENDCNYGLTERQKKREVRLEKQAADSAKEIGFMAYHQGDPRCCSLYLITKEMKDDYFQGVAIY